MKKLSVYLLALLLSWKAGAMVPCHSNWPQRLKIYRRAATAPYDLLQEIPVTWPTDGSMPPQNWTLQDTTAAAGVKYCYQVTAANSAGESGPTNEACGIPIDGEMIAVDIPAERIPLVSRRATDGSQIVSFLLNKSDTVAVNDSIAAVTATVTIATPAGKTVLISRRATDGSNIVSTLVNKSEPVYVNGQKK